MEVNVSKCGWVGNRAPADAATQAEGALNDPTGADPATPVIQGGDVGLDRTLQVCIDRLLTNQPFPRL